jgi:ABC-type Na+ efflux pump permease subunit
MSNDQPDRIKRLETFLYIILVMLILVAVGMFLIIQQIDNAVKEIKKFCWGDKVVDSILPDENQPYIKIQ